VGQCNSANREDNLSARTVDASAIIGDKRGGDFGTALSGAASGPPGGDAESWHNKSGPGVYATGGGIPRPLRFLLLSSRQEDDAHLKRKFDENAFDLRDLTENNDGAST
jgi:hypothetical protein